MTDPLFGVQVIESLAHTYPVWVRRPRSKRQRIRIKWQQRPQNWRTEPRRDFLVLEGGQKVLCHPLMARVLREQIKERKP